MSLVFDTGLSRSTREIIVGALAQQLDELRRPQRYLAAIVTAPRLAHGKEDEDFVGELAHIANTRVPCIAIALGDAKSETTSEDGLELTDTIEIGIYVVSGSQRGLVDGRLFVDAKAAVDDSKDPGVFAIMQHVTERIQGADLGIEGVRVPVKTGEAMVMTLANASIWELTFRVDVDLSINPDRDATAVMTSIEAHHKGNGIPDASSLDPLIDTVTSLDPEDT